MGITKLANGRWRLQIRRNGLRVDQTFPTEAQAKEAWTKYTGGKRRGRDVPTLAEAWGLYAGSLDFLGKRERTQATETSRIKRVLGVLGAHPVTSVAAEDVERYIAKRLADSPKPSADAVRLEVASLSALMNFCRKKSLISANPCIGVARPSAAIKPRRMQQEDEGGLISLLSHSNPRFRFAARLCLLVRETGARPGEWAGARCDDIDFEKRAVIFRQTKYKAMPRTVPLTAAAEHLLADQLEDVHVKNFEQFGASEFVFPAVGRDGAIRPLQYSAALRDMKKLGLIHPRVRAHTGRHEFISTLVESTDLDDSRIMSLVGHHSPASMEVYKHVRNVRFRPQIEEIEPQRRSARVRSIAAALNVPPRIIEALLLAEREKLEHDGKPDDGEELLFTSDFARKLTALARRLGAAPESRLEGLIRLRKLAHNPAATAVPGSDRSSAPKPVVEPASIETRSSGGGGAGSLSANSGKPGGHQAEHKKR